MTAPGAEVRVAAEAAGVDVAGTAEGVNVDGTAVDVAVGGRRVGVGRAALGVRGIAVAAGSSVDASLVTGVDVMLSAT